MELSISGKHDLIMLDVNLPKMNGFDLCREIRKQNIRTPVLMLTALGSTDDKLQGFDCGADDYIVKPFEFRELLARVKALLKRSQLAASPDNFLRIADLVMNLDSKTVKRGDKKVDLTAKEFSLLEFLLRNKGKVLSRMEITEKVWDLNFDTGTNVVDVYINFLRKKVDKNFPVKLIHTQVGMGYILRESE